MVGTHLARIAIGDIDGDGRKDIVAGELGTFGADDHKKGGVLVFRQVKAKTFQKRVILGELGRVADVGIGDFDGDGAADVVAAEFGWLSTGSVQIIPKAGAAKAAKPVVIDTAGSRLFSRYRYRW